MPDPLNRPVLALDSATDACSVAVWRNGALLAHGFEPVTRGHDAILMPMIRAAMREAGTTWPDLAGIGVTVGPGSFTGLRVGLAAARGLALASGLPVVGVTVFEALAAAADSDSPFLVAVDTKRGDVYAQAFDASGVASSPAGVHRPAQAAELLADDPLRVVGDGSRMIEAALAGSGRSVVAGPPAQPDARRFAALVARRLGEAPRTGMPQPLYLRAPEARLPAETATRP